MSEKKIELLVGLFVLLALASLSFLALKVSGLTNLGQSKGYEVSAYFDNAIGLKVGAKVSVAGVTVGEVSQISLDQALMMSKVDMEIAPEFDQLPEDSSASILTAGLLGDKYIGLNIGAEELFLVEGSVIHDTQSAVVLEELLGKVMTAITSD